MDAESMPKASYSLLRDYKEPRLSTHEFVDAPQYQVKCEKPTHLTHLSCTGLPEQLLAGVTQEFVISLTNPLESALTDCEIYIDGSIIPTRIYVKGIRDVPAGGKLVEAVRLTPHIPLPLHNKAVRSTKKSMTVSFTCRELGGLNHTLKVFVINIK